MLSLIWQNLTSAQCQDQSICTFSTQITTLWKANSRTKLSEFVNISKENRWQKIPCGRNKEGTNWCKCDGWVRLSGPGFSNSSPQGSPQTTQTIGKNIETHEKLENTAELIQNQGTTSDWGWVVKLLAIHHHWSHRRAALNPILSLGLCKCEFKVVLEDRFSRLPPLYFFGICYLFWQELWYGVWIYHKCIQYKQ